jgi:hypothetical protein
MRDRPALESQYFESIMVKASALDCLSIDNQLTNPKEHG